jgi:hypothetical protein
LLEFEILARGSFSEKALHVAYNPNNSRMPLSDEVKAYLKKYWERHKAWAEAHSLDLRNESLLRLIDFSVDDTNNTMHLELSLTEYREFAGTRADEFFVNRNRTELANPLGASAVIVTSDNRILCGRRPVDTEMNPNKHFVIGGFLTPRDINLFEGIFREIYEETGIPSTSHKHVLCSGLVYDLVKPHPEICFSTSIIESFETVCTYTPLDKEVVSLDSIVNTEESITSWLLKLHPTKVVGTAEGCLLLHGLQTFGHEWFTNTLKQLENTL